jgi:hypothetical protein
MMIDFDEPIRSLDGTNVKADEALTVGSCSIAALQQIFQGEDATAEIKVKRFKLALRIADASEPIALSNDEVATLKLVVGKFWNPLVVGRVFEAVDPEGMKA